MDELISVIVPVYNAEEYIKRCVESIQNQTYSNFELILVNDGSRDNSLALCQALAAQDDRIVVLNRTNGGASAARNTGLAHMHGQFVMFADSDDYVSPSYLENLYRAAKQGGYDIVQCDLESTSETNKPLNTIAYRNEDVEAVTKVQTLNDRKYKVSVWGKIYSAHLFEDFRFQEGIIYEDDASYYIFVDRAKKLAVLNETLYYYYMSDNSVMRNDQKDKSTAFIGIYEDRIRYFQERDNQELLDGSYDRFCLVLMLSLSASFAHGNNIGDRTRLLELFKKYYPLTIKSKVVGMKDKIMFTTFWLAPHVVGWTIGKMRG